MIRRQRFDLYLNTKAMGISHIADIVLVENSGSLHQVGFAIGQTT